MTKCIRLKHKFPSTFQFWIRFIDALLVHNKSDAVSSSFLALSIFYIATWLKYFPLSHWNTSKQSMMKHHLKDDVPESLKEVHKNNIKIVQRNSPPVF